MLIYEVLKIRDLSKLLRLLFATPQKLLCDPLWGRDPPVGNHCFKRCLTGILSVCDAFELYDHVSNVFCYIAGKSAQS